MKKLVLSGAVLALLAACGGSNSTQINSLNNFASSLNANADAIKIVNDSIVIFAILSLPSSICITPNKALIPKASVVRSKNFISISRFLI